MQENELKDLVDSILQKKTETADIEFKSAKEGYPEKLYDSFSSFSNTNGGIILFGIDEKAGYKVCEEHYQKNCHNIWFHNIL